MNVTTNTKGWKIRTDAGFIPFDGVAAMGVKPVHRVTFTDGTFVEATATHFFFTPDGRNIALAELQVGVTLMGTPDDKIVASVESVGDQMTYDVINTATHTFYGNGVLSHNCQFISSDPLLIDTLVLANMTARIASVKPVGRAGELVFYKRPDENSTYLVGMDPATGSGNDYTTIVAFEFPSMIQVAEFRSNTTSSVTAYQTLKKLLKIFERTRSTVYYSVENNGVGEAILALLEADESPPDTAELISDGKRAGMNTNRSTKIKACLTFKELVERHGITIMSVALVQEMKHFVRSAGSYAAKPGSTDDLIMATMIVVRLLSEIATFDQAAYDKMYSYAYGESDDDYSGDEPLPYVV